MLRVQSPREINENYSCMSSPPDFKGVEILSLTVR